MTSASQTTPDGRIIVATDGSANPNPGPAGWAWYVSASCWAAGGARNSTNNRAELAAVLNLLRATAGTGARLHILIDSKYVLGIMGGNNASKNTDLVATLRAEMTGRDITTEWVKGHRGNTLNEGADQRCGDASAAARRGTAVPTGPGWTL
ncbi:RNase H family protein [Curtobacterium sp. MCBD17_040]|uniref:ribonuclease HI n=1 Tax=Curtobacterium sp. MCBD17_040 TaxID=2175674 RepID=UPI000DAA43C8|nr:RNase H family protein [Curtobacterium sp. MCBD17_040]WIB65371.1 ribonuclease HI [Curtobacterium sp. MCBD17_040]